MDIVAPILNGLQNAFQKHEKEVVVELAIDRLLHYIGVYLIVALAMLSKATGIVAYLFGSSELAGDNIACYVTTNASSLDRGFMRYANQYCWESMKRNITKHNCAEMSMRRERLLQEPLAVINFVQWMPYFLLIEVMLFSVPSFFWHTAVGARLKGHLEFSLSFLKEVYEALKIIPAGLYRKLPYDKEGIYLDGWRRFRKDYKAEQVQGMNRRSSGGYDKSSKKQSKEIYEKEPCEVKLSEVINVVSEPKLQEGEAEIKSETKTESDQSSEEGKRRLGKILCGSMKDRHLFSMLCFENFASLEYHPYILSVYALTSTKAAEEDHKGVVPLKQGILRQFYNKENFTGNFLVKCYVIRYLYSTTVSLLMLRIAFWMFGSLLSPALTTKTFVCSIPYHSLRLACTLKRHWDTTALFIVNICIVLVYFALSVYQLYFVRWGSKRALCYYFEDMGDNFSVALGSAHVAQQRKDEAERRKRK